MSILINISLFAAFFLGLMICLSNWYFFYKTLKTKENNSQIGFLGGIIVYFSLYYLLPEKWQSVACIAFFIDISFPLFILGLILKKK